jgi:hypothetical protein
MPFLKIKGAFLLFREDDSLSHLPIKNQATTLQNLQVNRPQYFSKTCNRKSE